MEWSGFLTSPVNFNMESRLGTTTQGKQKDQECVPLSLSSFHFPVCSTPSSYSRMKYSYPIYFLGHCLQHQWSIRTRTESTEFSLSLLSLKDHLESWGNMELGFSWPEFRSTSGPGKPQFQVPSLDMPLKCEDWT